MTLSTLGENGYQAKSCFLKGFSKEGFVFTNYESEKGRSLLKIKGWIAFFGQLLNVK